MSMPIPTYDPIVFSKHRADGVDGDYRIRIDVAPARSYLGADLLVEAMEGEVRCIKVAGDALDIITISDDYGHQFIYRLGKYETLYDAFEIEWPD